MNRALWTGSAALLTASLGFSLSLFSLPSLPWGRWLLISVFAGAANAVRLISWQNGSSQNTIRPNRVFLTVGSGAVALAGLTLLWYWTGSLALAIGGPILIGLTTGATIIRPKLVLISVDPESVPWLPAIVRLATDLGLLVLIFPLVGFIGGGARLGFYPWTVSVALVPPSLAFLVASNPALRTPGPGRRDRRDRHLILGLILMNLLGVLIVGRFFLGSPEERLLGIAPATVIAFIAMAAFLHPSASSGLRIAEILVPATYISLIALFALIYAVMKLVPN